MLERDLKFKIFEKELFIILFMFMIFSDFKKHNTENNRTVLALPVAYTDPQAYQSPEETPNYTKNTRPYLARDRRKMNRMQTNQGMCAYDE